MEQIQQHLRRILILLLSFILFFSHNPLNVSGDTSILPENKPFSIAILFSGDTSENLTACQWIFDDINSSKIVGPNYAFRANFSEDLSNEMIEYPQIEKINLIQYTYTFNYFTNNSQDDPDHPWSPRLNVSTFDPYYCLIRLSVYENVTWDDLLGIKIETILLSKWYVEQITIIPSGGVPCPTPFGAEQFSLTLLLILSALTFISKNKH